VLYDMEHTGWASNAKTQLHSAGLDIVPMGARPAREYHFHGAALDIGASA